MRERKTHRSHVRIKTSSESLRNLSRLETQNEDVPSSKHNSKDEIQQQAVDNLEYIYITVASYTPSALCSSVCCGCGGDGAAVAAAVAAAMLYIE